MNLLSQIIERLNQRIGAGNIFDQIYGLSELSADGNEKAWVHYIGNGQAVPVTNFDAHQATIFWAKRGKITVQKVDSIKLSGCKALYETKFTLSAYAVARKSHLPCDAADAQDWLASRVLRLVSGTDPLFKTSIGVVSYEVIPNGYANEVKSLTANYEFACVTIDVDVNVVSPSEDGCYDTCGSGDIPLPDLIPCTPCLTEVAVDGVTITGNGTEADPLVAIGGGGGVGTLQQVTNLGNSTTNDIEFIASAGLSFDNGAFFRKGTTDAGNGGAKGTSQICSISYELKWEAGRLYYMEQDGFTIRDVTHNFAIVPQPTDDLSKGFVAGSRWSLDDGTVYLCSDATIGAAVWAVVSTGGVTNVTATSPIFSSGGATPDISIQPANLFDDGYLTSADFTSFNNKFDTPTGTNADYLDGTGTPTLFPTIPAAQVNSDWNAVSGVAEILNKPTIPVVTGFVPYTGATTDLDMGTHNVTADHIALNVSPSGAGFVVGATEWNNTIGSSQTLLKGGNVILKNGVDLVARIVNKVTPNTTLTKAAYQAVRVSGATGGRLSIKLAQADTDNNSADTIGLVCETIATNQEGFIITVGQLLDINTTGSLQGETWADGDVLYLSPTTAGRLTNIKPTGATGHIVVMGYVEYSHPNNGAIYVKVMNGWELDELHNVSISSPANNEALIYESSTQLWKNKTLATALGYTPVPTTRNINTTAPLSGGGDLSADRTLSIPQANGSTDGFLDSADWTTFNGKFNTPSGTTAQYVRGDGSLATFPALPILYKDLNNQTAVTGNTNNNKVVSVLIPANTITVGSIVNIKVRVGKTGGAGITTLRVYANTADSIVSPAPTLLMTSATSAIGNTYNGCDRNAIVKSSTVTQTAQANASIQTDASVGNATLTNSNIDWTVNQYLIFAIQNGANGDSTVLSYYQIEIK